MKKNTEYLKEYREKVKLGLIEPTKPKNPKEKWLEDKKSLRKSINAFCWECIGENKEEIRLCTAKNCPLYEVRPYQVKR